MEQMMQNRMISVSVLSNYIKNIFDAETLLFNIDVVGEISSWGRSGANVFFTIKDETALLNGVLFGYDGEDFKIGDKVIVTGSPKYYVKGGKLNFNASKIKLFGEGEIYKRFLELKQKLEKEGLFDPLHKLPMPQKIERIGVVTSETGAVIHDIINVATRRNSAQDIVLYPIKVQGIGADVEIAKGINFFSNYERVDAIIVGRGGGSDEDLSNFNSEIVARAVYNCKKFIVSAVGHETDNTICDLVADLRAPTPSAAAELLTRDGGVRKRELELILTHLNSVIDGKISLHSAELSNKIGLVNSAMQNKISLDEQALKLLELKIQKSNPVEILKHGYAKVELNGVPVKSACDLNENDNVSIYLGDGKLTAKILEVESGLRKKD
jgi:exodeoxyribonuclease VII large subunit